MGNEVSILSNPDVLGLFLRLLPAEFVVEARRQEGLRQNSRVYTDFVVIWLRVVQRWRGNGTLDRGVLELVRGLPETFWPNPCKRLRPGGDGNKPLLSSNPGSYNEARQKLPLTIVEKCCERASQQLLQQTERASQRRQVFFDGTTVRTAHSESLRQRYPPGSNQHGESHWPVIRMLVAHDLDTGLALRPVWGPVYGD